MLYSVVRDGAQRSASVVCSTTESQAALLLHGVAATRSKEASRYEQGQGKGARSLAGRTEN
eukprot:6207472-Pleurochrysis_carterae.AAC.3